MSNSTKYMLANMPSNSSEAKIDALRTETDKPLKAVTSVSAKKLEPKMENILANCLPMTPRKDDPKLIP